MKGKNMEKWFVAQGARIQRFLAPIEGEDEDDWKKRVMSTYESQSKARMATGTAAHAAFEAFHLGKEPTVAPEAMAAFDGYRRWYDKHVRKAVLAEETVVSKLGYAGTVDGVLELKDGRVIVSDTKAVEDTDNWKKKAYSERGEQLASYAAALYERGFKLEDACNVLINARTGEVHVHSWRNAAKDKAKWLGELFSRFKTRLRLFRETYSYDTAAAYERAMNMLRSQQIAKRLMQERRPVMETGIRGIGGLAVPVREVAMGGGIER